MSKKQKSKLLISIISLLLISTHVNALQFKVINNLIKPEKGELAVGIEIINNNSDLKAYEINIQSRDHDDVGKELRTEIKDEFIINPYQIILNPYEKKIINALFVSEEEITNEKVYRISVNEVLIPDQTNQKKEDGVEIKTKLSMVKSIFISPLNRNFTYKSSDLICKKNTDSCHINIENTGNVAMFVEINKASIINKSTKSNLGNLDENFFAMILPNKNIQVTIPVNNTNINVDDTDLEIAMKATPSP